MKRSKKLKTLAIIPARLGSKRLKNKNFLNFNGKPLINWTIDQALRSKNINRIIVSTDSKKFINKFKKNKKIILSLREKKFSTSKSPIEDVIIREIIKYKLSHYHNIILLQTTSPLRDVKFIDKSISDFGNAKNYFTGISLIKSKVKLSNLFNLLNKSTIRKIYKKGDNSIKDIYFPSGDIYISKVKYFLKNKTFYSKKIFPFFSKIYSDIDNLSDFKIAEFKKKNVL